MPRSSDPSSIDVWLPKDRGMVQQVVDVYFTRLNVHRPVFFRKVFEKALDDLYAERTVTHDPGFICSLYLVLALGTLSEISNRSAKLDVDSDDPMVSGATRPKSFAPDWPEHDEFFERALSVKPDLRVTISSLQALILLHWYLYTEVRFLLVNICTPLRCLSLASRTYLMASSRKPCPSCYRARTSPRSHHSAQSR